MIPLWEVSNFMFEMTGYKFYVTVFSISISRLKYQQDFFSFHSKMWVSLHTNY